MPKRQFHKAVSKKRKFVKDGVFYAELNDFLANELSEQGYAGCEVRVTPHRTEIIIRATNSAEVIGDNGRRIRELTALIQKRFKFPKTGLICFAEKVRNKGFSALTQAQAVKYRLLTGLTVRRAAYSCLKYIMDSEKKTGALGCEIIVSGKLRGQRAKGMKFRDGFMIHAGDAANYYIDEAVKHVHLPQGVIGIKVKIMKPYDATGRDGVSVDLPDKIQILDPKDEQYERDELATDRREMAGHLQQFSRPTGGGGGPGPGPTGGGGGMGGGPQPPVAPQQPMPPQGGFNDYGQPPPPEPQPPQQPQPPMAPQDNVMDQSGAPQYGGAMDQQGGQYGGQPVQQQDYPQGGAAQGGYNAPNTQFDQSGGQYGQPQGGQQFQQYDNQYGQPMQQQQQYQPVQQQYQQQPQPTQQQFGNQQQYYDQNRQQNYYQQ